MKIDSKLMINISNKGVGVDIRINIVAYSRFVELPNKFLSSTKYSQEEKYQGQRGFVSVIAGSGGLGVTG